MFFEFFEKVKSRAAKGGMKKRGASHSQLPSSLILPLYSLLLPIQILFKLFHIFKKLKTLPSSPDNELLICGVKRMFDLVRDTDFVVENWKSII